MSWRAAMERDEQYAANEHYARAAARRRAGSPSGRHLPHDPEADRAYAEAAHADLAAYYAQLELLRQTYGPALSVECRTCDVQPGWACRGRLVGTDRKAPHSLRAQDGAVQEQYRLRAVSRTVRRQRDLASAPAEDRWAA